MEASETGATPEEQEGQEHGAEGGAPAEGGALSDPAAPETEAEGGDAESADEAPGDERNPARDQAPVASDAQEAIIGDPGLRDEQQPQQTEGAATAANTPVRTSPPPPEAQSGVPLPEDRAAGVEPGAGEEPRED